MIFHLTFLFLRLYQSTFSLQARHFLEPYELFKSEAEEALEKTKNSLKVLREFKIQFENTRNSIDKYFKDPEKVKKWEFSNDLVFTRYDQFVKRLELIEVSILSVYNGILHLRKCF